MKSYRCIVKGKVHGGNFQGWVQTEAERLGLTGWVRNVRDREAEILIQGEAEKIATFRELLKTKAPLPEVEKITCNAITHDKSFDSFEMRG
ncbi:acylphosphatase [Salidesulfovibrio brasiliensis]|uniref:acylphosphatase n=1 Tax=Salidesulfovibrio brasiliensis TaxID=221711 RepID=UPI0006D0CF45|nr:acylphosphatase [Salidesulfovibrio brasiliensis]